MKYEKPEITQRIDLEGELHKKSSAKGSPTRLDL